MDSDGSKCTAAKELFRCTFASHWYWTIAKGRTEYPSVGRGRFAVGCAPYKFFWVSFALDGLLP